MQVTFLGWNLMLRPRNTKMNAKWILDFAFGFSSGGCWGNLQGYPTSSFSLSVKWEPLQAKPDWGTMFWTLGLKSWGFSMPLHTQAYPQQFLSCFSVFAHRCLPSVIFPWIFWVFSVILYTKVYPQPFPLSNFVCFSPRRFAHQGFIVHGWMGNTFLGSRAGVLQIKVVTFVWRIFKSDATWYIQYTIVFDPERSVSLRAPPKHSYVLFTNRAGAHPSTLFLFND